MEDGTFRLQGDEGVQNEVIVSSCIPRGELKGDGLRQEWGWSKGLGGSWDGTSSGRLSRRASKSYTSQLHRFS